MGVENPPAVCWLEIAEAQAGSAVSGEDDPARVVSARVTTGAWLVSDGYTPLTTANVLRLMANLNRWMEARGMAAEDLSQERAQELVAARRAER
jgi:hypothetical protein